MYGNKIIGMTDELLLHDCTVKQIDVVGQTVIFRFPEGFFVAAEERSRGEAKIEFALDSVEYDMRCFYTQYVKEAPFEKSYYTTREVSIDYLRELLHCGVGFTVLKYGIWESEYLIHMIVEGKGVEARTYVSLCIEMEDMKTMTFVY